MEKGKSKKGSAWGASLRGGGLVVGKGGQSEFEVSLALWTKLSLYSCALSETFNLFLKHLTFCQTWLRFENLFRVLVKLRKFSFLISLILACDLASIFLNSMKLAYELYSESLLQVAFLSLVSFLHSSFHQGALRTLLVGLSPWVLIGLDGVFCLTVSVIMEVTVVYLTCRSNCLLLIRSEHSGSRLSNDSLNAFQSVLRVYNLPLKWLSTLGITCLRIGL